MHVYDDHGGTIGRAGDLDRMRSGEKLWGNKVALPSFHVTAGPSSGVVTPPKDNLVYVLDRPRVWSVEVQAEVPSPQVSFTNLTLLILFRIETGTGSARFTRFVLISMGNTAPATTPLGGIVNTVIPVIPCQTMTVTIESIGWTNSAGGAAQDVALTLNAAACPYNRGREDS